VPPHTRRAVLVVEDESIVGNDIGQTLTDLGYEASGIASSAEEALARAAERRPDIALVDIRIKGRLDGIKTAQLLQERFGAPIVYLTAHADEATVERAAKTRPYGYLLKPVKPGELKSAIEIALFRHGVDGRESGAVAAGSLAESARSMSRDRPAPDAQAVRLCLEQVQASPDFDASKRSRDFLGFIVEEALSGRGEALTQSEIAVRVFGRKADFDALLDPIVRIQAGRLRRSLERYYLLGGKRDPVRIDLPKGGYVPAFRQVNAGEGLVATSERQPVAAEAYDSWPLLEVGAFEVVSARSGEEDLASRFREALAMELGRYRDVRVVLQQDAERLEPARQGGARFELRGRLLREEKGWRVTAGLVDRASGEHVWSDEYHTSPRPGQWSGTPDDVARVVAARVGAEHGVIVQALAGEYRKRPAFGGVYGAILRAHMFFFARDARELAPAVEALRSVVAEQPEIATAWMYLARLYQVNHAFELSELLTPIDEAVAFAQQAVRLDPTMATARCVLASALLIKGELQSGRSELDQVLRLNPGSLVYLEMIGYLMALLGDWERGIALVRGAIERNPHHLPHAYFALWADHLRRGEFEQAYTAALEYRDPTFFWRSLMRACCLGHLGRTSEAQAIAAELLSEKPGFEKRGRILIGRYIKPVELQECVVDGLKKAGLKLSRP